MAKIEVNVKFNIGDIVLIKEPFPGYGEGGLSRPAPFKAVVSGFVIHANKKSTRVMYTLEPLNNHITYRQKASLDAFAHKRRWNAKDLELIN